MTNEQLLANYYKGYKISSMIDSDVKSIKKINNTYVKFIRTENEIYYNEIVNILKMLSNYIDIKNGKEYILFYIEDDLKDSISNIMGKI